MKNVLAALLGFALGSAALATERALSRPEILALLETKVPHWSEPGHAEATAEVAALIRSRGVDFAYDLSFDAELHEAGAQLPVLLAIHESYRGAGQGPAPFTPAAERSVAAAPQPADSPPESAPPAPSAPGAGTGDLVGTWRMGVSAVGTSHRTDGSALWRLDAATYAEAGFLRIHPDGAYVWKVYPSDPPERHRTGRWEPAAPEDLRLASAPNGSGLILRMGHDGVDWLVTRRASGNGRDQITVARLDMQAIHHWGSRAGD